MANTTYSEKLKNPLWQKKRLEILNRDEFTCVICSDNQTELHIHHKEYTTGRKPWEYEDSNFQTLCKHCHEVIEAYKSCGVISVIASKTYNVKTSTFLLSTILSHPTDGLILSIDRFPDVGEPEHVLIIDKQPFGQIAELFTHAEKLLK